MISLWRKSKLVNQSYHHFQLACFSISNSAKANNQLAVVKNDAVDRSTKRLELTLKSAVNPLQVLDTLPSNRAQFKALTSNNIVSILQTIRNLHIATKDSIDSKMITTHPKFELVCRRLKYFSPMLTIHETIDSLKVIFALNVPANSEISLILLNLLRHEINYLSMEQILFLEFLLKRSEVKSELQKTIMASLPIVFEKQLFDPIDDKEMNSVKLLEFFVRQPDLVKKDDNVLKMCKMVTDQIEILTLDEAITIIHSLCAMNRFDLEQALRLYCISLQYVAEKVDEIPISKLLSLAKRVVITPISEIAPSKKHVHQLIGKCGEKISQEDLGLDIAVLFQRILKNISFKSTPLTEYMASKIENDVDSCRTMGLKNLLTIIQAFASNFYTQCNENGNEKWHSVILPTMLSNEHLTSINAEARVWLALQLMTLGYFDQKLIKSAFNSNYLDQFLCRKNIPLVDLLKVLIFYQTSAMNSPDNISSIDENQITAILEIYVSRLQPCPIQTSLIEELRTDLVLTNVRTKYSHLIRTLVKVNKETSMFVPFPEMKRDSSGLFPLDDIPCKENEVLVCVDGLLKHVFYSNHRSQSSLDEKKIGQFRLRKEQLEQLDVKVCEVIDMEFGFLNKHKRFDFLRELIVSTASSK